MKRDMDLCRALLNAMAAQDGGFVNAEKIDIDGYTQDQLDHHYYLLWQAGLIEAVQSSGINSASPTAIPLNLTWAGQDFLDAARDPGLWKKAKEKVIGPAGGVAFSVLLEWLKQEALKQLGLHP